MATAADRTYASECATAALAQHEIHLGTLPEAHDV